MSFTRNLTKSSSMASSSLRSYYSTPASTLVGTPPATRRPASFRGTFLGFLVGFSAASAYGYSHLLTEYNHASSLMLASVEELQSSTNKISSHLQRLTTLESDLKSLRSSSSTKEDLTSNRQELKSVYEGLHEDILALKNRIWGVEKDLNEGLKGVKARGSFGEPKKV